MTHRAGPAADDANYARGCVFPKARDAFSQGGQEDFLLVVAVGRAYAGTRRFIALLSLSRFWLRPAGNGPYRYLRYQSGTMVELEANPDYYKGEPRIERIVMKFSGEAAVTELLSGNVDAICMNDSTQLAAVANDPRFQTHWQPNLFRSVCSE